ncbi:MAM and LDL-receptor class A domain-containing protein 1 [Lingula anatina]|uniref:MAM and LDL-receptor class A domain-containing protein 1 n=1 Tax=Lingula anatina TaxID=7574 RepID=A0A1S3K3V1_LINAN|nr:MAM and LDL-receptor class A domain-containing protein 1 [Lingula anatina]|eukprot:XP_013416941.1 MAM and LDL-receptor class A domain-containing protein 1 [Lingula anatina]
MLHYLRWLAFLLAAVKGGPAPGDETDAGKVQLFHCNFGTGEGASKCGIIQSQDDDFDWTLHNGETTSKMTGPAQGHTTGDVGDNYFYLEASSPRVVRENARFMLPPTIYTISCLQFWYHMHGSQVGSLRIFLKAFESLATEIWGMHGDQGNEWRRARITVNPGIYVLTPKILPSQILFEGVVGDGWKGDIAIDDVLLVSGECSVDQFACDFSQNNRSDWCGIVNMQNDRFDWDLNIDGTLTPKTGPSSGHTGNAYDFYAYAESSHPRKHGDYAVLRLPYVLSSKTCLQFWYHMKGDEGMYLKVRTVSTQGHTTVLWSRHGCQGDDWQQANVTLYRQTEVSIEFIAVIDGFNSDIAIDDLFIHAGACEVIEFKCDFGEGQQETCGIEQAETDDFDWSFKCGSTPSIGTGPVVGHTDGGLLDFYMFTETSGIPQGHKASATLPFAVGADSCLTFWYHMYGTNQGTLRILASIPGEPRQAVWMRAGNQGNLWNYGSVQISRWKVLHFEYEKTVGSTYRSDVAIDDIHLYPGHCQVTKFECNFGEGPKGKFCGIEQDLHDEMQWVLNRGVTRTWQTGPRAGHTTGGAEDWYIYTDGSNQQQEDMARLRLPFQVGNTACLSFWYMMYGADVGTLRVMSSHMEEAGEVLYTMTHEQSVEWQEARVTVKPGDNLEIDFTSHRGKSFHSDIALDDIKLEPGACLFSTFTCDFGMGEMSSWCGITQDVTTDNFNWTLHSGSTPDVGTGPLTGHTTGELDDCYIYTEITGEQIGHSARIDLPVLLHETSCLDFHFHMHGTVSIYVGALKVLAVNPEGETTELLVLRGDQGNEWKRVFVTVPVYKEALRLQFCMVDHGSNLGDIALDDIYVKTGKCHEFPYFYCNFGFLPSTPGKSKQLAPTQDEITSEEVKHAYQACSVVNSGDAVLTPGARLLSTTVSEVRLGHTLGTSGDLFLRLNHQSVRAGKSQSLKFPFVLTSGGCFSFWYYMVGTDFLSVNLLMTRPGKVPKNIWTLNRTTEVNIWTKQEIPIDIGDKVELELNLRVDAYISGAYDFGLDDIKISPENCTIWECNFGFGESGKDTCEFTQNSDGDEYDWLVGRGLEDLQDTGPKEGHTTGSQDDNYIFTQCLHPAIVDRRKKRALSYHHDALLYFPVYLSRQSCFTFWYHMYGKDIGTLSLNTHRLGFDNEMTEVWRRDGNQGDKWLFAQVTLTPPETIEFEFAATGVQDSLGEIALDDLRISPGKCNVDPCSNRDFCQCWGERPTCSGSGAPCTCQPMAATDGYCDSVGKDFVFAVFGGNSGEDFSVIVTSASPYPATVTLSAPRHPAPQTQLTIAIPPGATEYLTIPGLFDIAADSKDVKEYGLHLQSDADVAVFVMKDDSTGNDIFSVLPTDALGERYIAVTSSALAAEYPPDISKSDVVAIVAVHDETRVSFFIPAVKEPDRTLLIDGEAYLRGQSYTRVLSRFQATIIVDDDMDYSINGLYITADKPVSVITGGTLDADTTMYQHLFPLSAIGKRYALLPSGGDTRYHIQALEDNTTCHSKPGGGAYHINDRGDTYKVTEDGINHIFCDKDAQIVGFTGYQNVSQGGLLLMSQYVLPDWSQMQHEYWFTLPQFDISILVHSVDREGLRINGEPLSLKQPAQSVTIPDLGSFDILFVDVSDYQDESVALHLYNVDPLATFFILGFKDVFSGASHSYSATSIGGRAAKINTECRTSIPVFGDMLDNDCDGRIDEEIANNFDDDGDGRTDEDLAKNPDAMCIKPPVRIVCTATPFSRTMSIMYDEGSPVNNVYVLGHEDSCSFHHHYASEYLLDIDLIADLNRCGVKLVTAQNRMVYHMDVVARRHALLIYGNDKTFTMTCTFDIENKVVADTKYDVDFMAPIGPPNFFNIQPRSFERSFEGQGQPTSLRQTAGYSAFSSLLLADANIHMEVVQGVSSKKITVTKVGDWIRLKVSLIPSDVLQDLYITNCVMYESLQKRRRMQLIDSQGCGVESLIPHNQGFQSGSGEKSTVRSVYSPKFRVIKYEQFNTLYFECQVSACASQLPGNRCDGNQCQPKDTEESYHGFQGHSKVATLPPWLRVHPYNFQNESWWPETEQPKVNKRSSDTEDPPTKGKEENDTETERKNESDQGDYRPVLSVSELIMVLDDDREKPQAQTKGEISKFPDEEDSASDECDLHSIEMISLLGILGVLILLFLLVTTILCVRLRRVRRWSLTQRRRFFSAASDVTTTSPSHKLVKTIPLNESSFPSSDLVFSPR